MINNKQDLEQFSLIMWGIAEEFGGKISKEGIKIKFEAMKDFSIEEISQAGTWLTKYRKKTFPAVPTVQEFAEVISNIQGKLSEKSNAEIQADLFIKAIKYYNGTPIVWEDRVTNLLMNTKYNLSSLSQTTKEENNVWLRKQFITDYQNYSEVIEKGQVKVIEHKNPKLLELAKSVTKEV